MQTKPRPLHRQPSGLANLRRQELVKDWWRGLPMTIFSLLADSGRKRGVAHGNVESRFPIANGTEFNAMIVSRKQM
jgi:hypothetical protein